MSLVRAVFYTEGHRIAGKVRVQERLNEALNDSMDDYVEVLEPRIAKMSNLALGEVPWDHAVVNKSEILVATLDSERHESATTRFYKATPKSGTMIGCLAGSIELYGTAHVHSRGSARDLILHVLGRFFPMTEAVLRLPYSDADGINTQLALVNRDKVSAMTLLGSLQA